MNRSVLRPLASAGVVLIALTFLARTSEAADRYWVASSSGNWNDTANWSATSGGAGGATVPGSSDVAIFNGQGVGNCLIDANVNVAGFSIVTGYTGTVTQSAGFTVMVGASHFVQQSGSFAGGDGDITVNGTITLSGGSFTSTSGVLGVGRTAEDETILLIEPAATFNHNGGTVEFRPRQQSDNPMRVFTVNVAEGVRFNHVIANPRPGGYQNAYPCRLTTADGVTAVAEGNFTHYCNPSDGTAPRPLYGSWEVHGNLIVDDLAGPSNAARVSLGTITIRGTADQTYSYASGHGTAKLVIDKPSGTVSAAVGTTSLKIGAFDLLSGTFIAPEDALIVGRLMTDETIFAASAGTTFDHNGGTVEFRPKNSGDPTRTFTVDVEDGIELNNVIVNAEQGGFNNGYRARITTASGTRVVALGDFATVDGQLYGTWECQGNVVIGAGTDLGTGSLVFSGGLDQTFDHVTGSSMPTGGVTVDKDDGAVLLLTDMTLSSVSIEGGALSLGGHGLTVSGVFSIGADGTFRIDGDETFSLPTANSGTISYAGDGAYGIIDLSYHHLALEGEGVYSLTKALDLGGDLRILDGTFAAGGNNISVAGDWIRSPGATYTASANTVTLTGSGQSILGSTTFANLTKVVNANDTLTFEAGSRQTVTGAMTLKGIGLASDVSEADTIVQGGTSADTNFGSDADMMVKNTADLNYYREAYLRFDVSSFETVTSAILRLYPTAIGELNVTQECLPVTGAWEEMTVTYNSKPALGASFASWIPAAGVPVEVDILALAQAAAAGGGKVNVCLRGVTSGTDAWARYASREAAQEAQRPRLIVTGEASGIALSLRSTVPGTQWEIDPQGARDIANLDVQDSANVNAERIDAYSTSNTDSLRNSRWSFVPTWVELTAPVGGSYEVEDEVDIEWTLHNLTGAVQVELWKSDKSEKVKDIATVTDGTTGEYAWTAEAPVSGTVTQYHIKLVGAEGDTAWTEQPITVNPPYVRVEYPNGGETLIDAQSITFEWDSRGVAAVTVEIRTAGGSTLWNQSSVASPGPLTVTPDLGLALDTYELCVLHVSGTDEHGRLWQDSSNLVFTVWGAGSEGVRILGVTGERTPFYPKDRATITWRALAIADTAAIELYDGPDGVGAKLADIATGLPSIREGTQAWTLPDIDEPTEFWLRIVDSEGVYEDWHGPIKVELFVGLGKGEGCAAGPAGGGAAAFVVALMLAALWSMTRRRSGEV